ncbi:MAG: PRC-barrel domain containing protein [Planctomycetes bacterium]|nr:PRC-barrel domain containing protein [Planctomycetota bacterium]
MHEKTNVIRIGGMAIALLALSAGVLQARIQADPRAPHEPRTAAAEPATGSQPRLELAGDLIGARVVDHQNKWLGTIQEIVLTPNRDAVDYAVLSYGGFWGVLEKRFAVPWNQLQLRPQEPVFVLNVDRKDFDQAQGLGRDFLPATAHEDWLGIEPGVGAAAQAAPDLEHRRLSRLVGVTVRNGQGETLGQLEDFVIDADPGAMAYAILWIPRDLPDLLERDLAAVPWTALEIRPDVGTARLDADRQTLEAVAFHARNFPDLADAQYSRQLHARFDVTPYGQALGFLPAEPQPQTP